MRYLIYILFFFLFNIAYPKNDNLAKYIKYINEGSIEMKRIAVQKLGEYRNAIVVKHLIKVLSSKDYLVRYYAKKSLIKLDRLAIPSLIGALKNKNYHIRISCVQALGKIGLKSSIPALISCLRGDKNSLVRASCVEALGDIGDKNTLDYILKSLNDRHWKVRGASAKVLGILGDSRAINPLIKKFGDDSNYVRLHVVGALGRLKSKKAVPFLIMALEDHNPDTREMAAWALGRIKDKRAVKPLVYAFVKDNSGNVRKEAREALRKMGYSYKEIDKYSKKR